MVAHERGIQAIDIQAIEETIDCSVQWRVNMAMDPPDNAFNVRCPATWSPASSDADVGGCLRKVIPAYGQRIEEASGKLITLLQSEARSPMGARAAVLRVSPKGGLRDSVESMSWAPKAWLNQDIAPEGLRSCG